MVDRIKFESGHRSQSALDAIESDDRMS